MQKNPSIVDILWRYQQHETLSELDRHLLEEWLRQSEANEDLFDDISNEEAWNRQLETLKSKDSKATWNLIRKRIEAGQTKQFPVFYHWKKYVAIAAVFAGAVIGTYFLVIYKAGRIKEGTEPQTERFKNDVTSGPPKATLVLSDGRSIRLDTAKKGNLAGSKTIWKTDSNSLVLQESTIGQPESFNTLSTRAGTTYQITLADGSRVWLDAGSSLSFPSGFYGGQRRVTLSGEGYFEITKNSAKPFLVESGNGIIRVLGTRFNIRNYPEEPISKTTLLEGSISLRAGMDSAQIKPGDQAGLRRNGKISVDSVNAQQAIAWRKNLFWFQSEPFDEIMSELSRWYPIHVTYQGKITEKFTGILPRSRSLIEVLKTLELPGYVSFRIHGNEVEVIPRKT